MPSPGRRSPPPPPRISSRHSPPPSGRRRSPDPRRRPGPPPSRGSPRGAPRGGGSSRGRSRERRRSPPGHAPPQLRQADSRSRPRRSRSPIPTRIRTPPPALRVRTPPPIQRIRTPPPPAPLPRSFPVPSGSATKRKVPVKDQRGRMPERGRQNGSQRSSSRSVISPPRKMNRSRSPRPRQEIPLVGPAVDPVSRDYRSRSSMTYNVPISPPDTKGRLLSPTLPLTDRFRNEGPNVFKGAEGDFNMTELRNTRIHVILNPQPLEHNEIDPAHLSVVRRPELLGVDRHILEERGHYHPHRRSEGSKPIFARDEILQASRSPDKYEAKYEPKYEPNEHERIVIVDNRPAPREGTRYTTSPGRYESERFDGPSTSRDTRYNGNEDYRPTREYDRPAPSFDQRENLRSERQGGDLRLQLEYRHDSARYSSERSRPQDHRSGSSSDLRARLVEKRTDRHEERPYTECERRPSPVERRPPTERSRHHRSPEYEVRREYEGRRSSPEPKRESGSSSRRPRGEFESRSSRAEPSSSSSRRAPRDSEVVRRRRSESNSPPPSHYHREEEYSEQPPEWETNPEHVPRGGMYFEHDNREDEMPHGGERGGRGRGMSRMRGSNYRGRGQRGGPMMRGGSSIRGVRLPFRGAPYPRGGGFLPPRRGYAPRRGRKSSPNWEHDMFDSLSDLPAS